jgi:hypothetical protein
MKTTTIKNKAVQFDITHDGPNRKYVISVDKDMDVEKHELEEDRANCAFLLRVAEAYARKEFALGRVRSNVMVLRPEGITWDITPDDSEDIPAADNPGAATEQGVNPDAGAECMAVVAQGIFRPDGLSGPPTEPGILITVRTGYCFEAVTWAIVPDADGGGATLVECRRKRVAR